MLKKINLAVGKLLILLVLINTITAEEKSNDTRLNQENQKEIKNVEIDKNSTVGEKKETKAGATKGLTIQSGDDLSLRFRLLAQNVAKFYLEKEGKNDLVDSFFARRFRPYLEGTAGKNLSFRVMPDFAGATLVVNDIYLDYAFTENLKLRVGKTKVPYSLNFWRSVSELFFIDFSIAENLAPRRDFGAIIDGSFWGKSIQYQLGVFNGTADGKGAGSDRDVQDNKEISVRIFFEPFVLSPFDFIRGLGLGIAGTHGITYGRSTDAEITAFKSPGQENFFSYKNTSTADGRRNRYSPQGYYFWGPFGLIGEYLVTEQDLLNTTTRILQKNTAWDISLSFVLGGKNGFAGVKNNSDFNWEKNTWGAVELAFRYGVIKIDERVFPDFADISKSASQATAWGIVLKWHLSSVVKLAVDFENTVFKNGAGTLTAVENRATENVLQSWLQINI